jgi:hypothetical protein
MSWAKVRAIAEPAVTAEERLRNRARVLPTDVAIEVAETREIRWENALEMAVEMDAGVERFTSTVKVRETESERLATETSPTR